MKTFIIIIIFFFSKSIIAQNYLLQGYVLNQNAKPIVGATIKLLQNDSLGMVKFYAITNSNGYFEIQIDKHADNLWLQISSIGYTDFNELFKSTSLDSMIPKQIRLLNFVGVLPSISVKSEAAIIRRGDTTTFKVKAFEKGNENNLGDLLKKLPGLAVDENGKLSFNGKSISRILLENDDLFGSNYATLTNNSGISGIEEIDVIENYKDESELTNKYETGKETILNLRYKKKKLRLFGNNSLSIGLPENYREFKTNVTGIFSKNKFVFNVNKNTIGVLASNIFGNESEIQLVNNETEKVPTPINLYSSAIRFNDIKPLNSKEFRVFTNNSRLVTANHLIKFNKKFSLKTIAHILQDNYSHANTSITTVNNPILPLIIIQNNFTNKINSLTNIQTLLNWTPNSFFQTIFQYSFNKLNYNQERNGQFFSRSINQYFTQNALQHRANLAITKLTKGGGIISGSVFYNSQKLSYDYLIENPLYDTSFQVPTTFNYLQQSVVFTSNLLASQIKYATNINGYAFSFSLQTTNSKSNLSTNSNVFNTRDLLSQLAKGYNNGVYFVTKMQTLSFNFTKTYIKKIQISSGVQLFNSQLKMGVIEDGLTKNRNRFFLNPSFSTQFKLNKKKIFIFNFQLQPTFPLIQQLNKSYVFTGVNNAIRGVDSLNINSGYNISAGYLFVDPVNTGIIFNTFCLLSNTPPNYLTNLATNGFFVFNQLFQFNRNNSFTTLSSRLEKNLSKIKSTIVTNINITNSLTYFSFQGQITNNRSNIFQVETKYRTNWEKWFNLSTNFLLRYQIQKSIVLDKTINQFSNTDLVASSLISLKAFKKWFIDIQNEHVINVPNNTKTQSLWFTDVQVKYNISKRLSSGIILRNLFNKKSFISNEISNTQNVFNTFNLVPFFCLFNIQYKF